MSECPCQSQYPYQKCCGQYIENKSVAPTPETLMRSRYTAYTQANINYIVATQKSKWKEEFLFDEAVAWAKKCKWLGLVVQRTWIDEKNPDRGFVEFTAHYKENGKKQQLHEVSEFARQEGQWFYLSG